MLTRSLKFGKTMRIFLLGSCQSIFQGSWFWFCCNQHSQPPFSKQRHPTLLPSETKAPETTAEKDATHPPPHPCPAHTPTTPPNGREEKTTSLQQTKTRPPPPPPRNHNPPPKTKPQPPPPKPKPQPPTPQKPQTLSPQIQRRPAQNHKRPCPKPINAPLKPKCFAPKVKNTFPTSLKPPRNHRHPPAKP